MSRKNQGFNTHSDVASSGNPLVVKRGWGNFAANDGAEGTFDNPGRLGYCTYKLKRVRDFDK